MFLGDVWTSGSSSSLIFKGESEGSLTSFKNGDQGSLYGAIFLSVRTGLKSQFESSSNLIKETIY